MKTGRPPELRSRPVLNRPGQKRLQCDPIGTHEQLSLWFERFAETLESGTRGRRTPAFDFDGRQSSPALDDEIDLNVTITPVKDHSIRWVILLSKLSKWKGEGR
jgi:hypothetical protein